VGYENVKTVLITGAGRGIGLATARAFAAAGWRVISLDKEFGGEVIGERLDFDLCRVADMRSTSSARSRVEIKSQVAGQIESIRFTEGQDVTAGQVLLEIDKRPYEDALHQAQAALERDQAQISQAQASAQKDGTQATAPEADANRFNALARQKLVSEQQQLQYATASETAAASVRADQAAAETARASLKVDEVAVERAQLDITYC
jgi:multidrug efflux system membrane fusion protein